MSEALHRLNALGWDWHENGVVLSVQIDGGAPYRVLVPLNRVWHEFNKEFSAVGCPFEPSIGGVVTVSGLFSSITKAVSSVAKKATGAVAKAASSVAKTAANYATLAAKVYTAPLQLAGKAVGLGSLTDGLSTLMTGPISAVADLANGGRIDKVALGNLKKQLAATRAVAPYAQIVLSNVPGVGTGLSAAIGAGLALAQGQSITDALAAGVRGALPGGPIAAAGFDVGMAVMQGKPVSAVVLNAMPISPAAKSALVRGLSAAQQLAKGQKVSQVLIDNALAALPPEAKKAVQVGAALGQGKWMQAAGGVAKAAGVPAPPSLVAAASKAKQTYDRGVAAATAIKRGQTSAENLKRVQAGLVARNAVAQIVSRAAQGDPRARAFAAALHKSPRVGAPIGASFKPRYHTSTQVGALFNFSALRNATNQRRMFGRVYAR